MQGLTKKSKIEQFSERKRKWRYDWHEKCGENWFNIYIYFRRISKIASKRQKGDDEFGKKIFNMWDFEQKGIIERRASRQLTKMHHYIFSFEVFDSCLCFDPSAPVDSRISRIADMNYGRYRHSLIVANGRMYAIGG